MPAGLTACDKNNMSHAMVLHMPADLTACRIYATSIEQSLEITIIAQSVRTACTGKHHMRHIISHAGRCAGI